MAAQEEVAPTTESAVVMELDDLVASHDSNLRVNPEYPANLQPREREEARYRLQVEEIAKNNAAGKTPAPGSHRETLTFICRQGKIR